MKREILYRFFEGTATVDEEVRIKEWVERSQVNFDSFMHARKEYDALVLTGSGSLSGKKRKVFTISRRVGGIAAAVVAVLIIGGVYFFSRTGQPEAFNTLIVPAGQRINLILSDNSTLWLNANTEFRYPTKFAKDNRTVYLNGEAYFEVSKDENKPFIVKTGQGDVRVTGTTFNVEAYKQYNTFETSLFEGGVDIYRNDKKLVSLEPNEKSTLLDNQLVLSRITDMDEYLWRDGLIAFKSKQLDEILITLEKYFDVDIRVRMEHVPQHTYTGKFRQTDGVDYALRVLQRSIRFTYERDEESGIIYIN